MALYQVCYFVLIAYPRWPPQANNSLPLDPMGNSFKDLSYSLGTKGHVSFCHHFASVVVRVCKLFIFSSSSLKPLNRFGPNLQQMFIGSSSTRIVILVQIGNPTWLPGPIMCSDWLKFLISHVRWLFLSNFSEGGPVGIFKCGSRKEKYLGSVAI